ncbi:MAG: hypothetical protein MJY74_04570 [Bacteroidaceae bacterium]|nr:hypothetical protein [Bacteroidaceae bacterium]
MDKDGQEIKKELDRSMMINYFITNAMFESLPKGSREEYISAIRRIFEPVMHIFNEPLTDEDYEFLADMPLSEILRNVE